MPYITNREQFEDIKKVAGNINTPGELNYCITMLVNGYIATHVSSYETFNALVGAIESAKLEFYRRIVAPYEDVKVIQNGDVYDK